MNKSLFFLLIVLILPTVSAGLFDWLAPDPDIVMIPFYPKNASFSDLNANNFGVTNIYANNIDANAVHANYWVARNFIDSNFLHDVNFFGNLTFANSIFGGSYYGDGSNLTGILLDVNGTDIRPQSVSVDNNLTVRGDSNFTNIGLDGNFFTKSTINASALDNPNGALFIQPEAAGALEVFAEGDLAGNANGQAFRVWRKSVADGDASFTFYLDQWNRGVFWKGGIGDIIFRQTGTGDFLLYAAGGEVKLQSTAEGDTTVFESAAIGENPYFQVYGYPALGTLKYGQMKIVDSPTAFQISTDANNVEIVGDVNVTGDIQTTDINITKNANIGGATVYFGSESTFDINVVGEMMVFRRVN